MAVRPIDGDALHTVISAWPWGIMYKSWVQSAIAFAPTLTPLNNPLISGFDVIDTKTGEYPDLWEIALK